MARTTWRPTESITISGKHIDYETETPIAGSKIQLQQYVAETGLWKPIGETTTGGDGSYSFTIPAPGREQTARVRTYYPATKEYAADASPSITLTWKTPKAAKTTVTLTVA